MRLTFCAASTLLLVSASAVASSQSTAPARQTPIAATAPTAVPALIPFSSIVLTPAGKPLTGDVTATILLYKDEAGGEPLWSESQAISLDPAGHYQMQLGASSPSGLPLNLFATGEARWIEVLIPGQASQPRVLLMSVPYAMKSADAATLGGLPPSAFALANSQSTQANVEPSSITPTAAAAVTTPGGTSGYIPAFTSAAIIANSTVFTSGAKVGLNTATPAATLDVNGTTILRGPLTLPATGTATSASSSPSQSLNFVASAYNSSSSAVVTPTFQLKSVPSGNDTSAPGANLDLLYNANSGEPAQTGLSIASSGLIKFVASQTFPGTVSSFTAVSPLAASGPSGAVSLSLNATALESTLNSKYAQLSATNAFTGANTFAGASTFKGSTSFTQPVTFASGQTFGTGAGSGTITGVTAGPGLTGGGTSGKVTLNIDEFFVPTLSSANNFTQSNSFMSSSTSAPAIYGETTAGPQYSTSGVYGKADNPPGEGVLGVLTGQSQTGSQYGGNAGVWGDTSGGLQAVLGTADEAFGGRFLNHSTSGQHPTLEAFANGSGDIADFLSSAGGQCYIDNLGDLGCTGSKSAVVPVDDNTRKVALYAVESPENWFEDFGSGHLTHGAANISFESVFAQTVNLGTDYHVFLTPNGDCKGLYVTNKTATSFEVRELGNGHSTVTFDYRIVARRKGYETIRLADRTKEMDNSRLTALKTSPATKQP